MSRNEPGEERVAQVIGRAPAKALRQQAKAGVAGRRERGVETCLEEKSGPEHEGPSWWKDVPPGQSCGHLQTRREQTEWPLSVSKLSQFGY